MMKIYVFLMVGVFLFSGCVPITMEEEVVVEEIPEGNVVVITSAGFEPKTLSIKKSKIVTWINKDTRKHWPASDIHPTHTVYPGSGIVKCGTPEAENIFDACKGLEQGESYSFKFDEVGFWDYHDHLRPSLKGTIIVG